MKNEDLSRVNRKRRAAGRTGSTASRNEVIRPMGRIRGHWGNRSPSDRRYQVAANFVAQLEESMGRRRLTATNLARRLNVTKGRVSQILNNPGNLTLASAIEWARALGLKATVVAYDDGDPKNACGSIDPEVFAECWRRCGKPRDFFALGLAESPPSVAAVDPSASDTEA